MIKLEKKMVPDNSTNEGYLNTHHTVNVCVAGVLGNVILTIFISAPGFSVDKTRCDFLPNR
jgi:hypothetical protein